jgi:hypothetical protein
MYRQKNGVCWGQAWMAQHRVSIAWLFDQPSFTWCEYDIFKSRHALSVVDLWERQGLEPQLC